MRLFRRPALWAVIVAAIYAFTIGGQPFTTLPTDGGDGDPVVFSAAQDAVETVAAAGPRRR